MKHGFNFRPAVEASLYALAAEGVVAVFIFAAAVCIVLAMP